MSVRRLDPVQPASFAFTPENLAWAKKLIDKYPPGKQASAVIPLLWRAQEQNDGWVSRKAIETVAGMLGMADIRVLEVATFYTMFQLYPVGTKAHIQVCGTTPCMLRGAEDLINVCKRKIHPEPHHVTADGALSWEEVECLGACVNAPMIQVVKDTYEDLTPEKLEQIIDEFAAGKKPKPGPQIDRQFSAPVGGPDTLIDPSLYSGQRTFTRVEPPPPPPPAAPSAAPATPAAAPAAPAAPAAAAAKPPEAPKPAEAAKPAEAPKPAEPVKPAAIAATPAPLKAPEATPAIAAPAEKPALSAPVEKPALPAPEEKPAIAMPAPAAPAAAKPVAPAAPVAAPKPAAAKPEPQARPDGTPELLKKPRAGSKADDLKLIWGVGPAFEKLLNKTGVWHFDQIASWSSADIDHVDALLKGFHGRIRRDEWVKQAKKLATGWRPDNAVGERPTGKK